MRRTFAWVVTGTFGVIDAADVLRAAWMQASRKEAKKRGIP